VTTLRATALDKIQEFLLRGERRQAYHYALDERLWAHAMIIASSVDKDAWKEVTSEFIRAELGVTDEARLSSDVPLSNGREGLKVAYSLYSGQGAVAGKLLFYQSKIQLLTHLASSGAGTSELVS